MPPYGNYVIIPKSIWARTSSAGLALLSRIDLGSMAGKNKSDSKPAEQGKGKGKGKAGGGGGGGAKDGADRSNRLKPATSINVRHILVSVSTRGM